MDKSEIIGHLQLEPHPLEGGYFHRTYESSIDCDTEVGSRKILSSIYYLLSSDQPVGHLHKNRSDILHYHQLGAAIEYLVISPEDQLSRHILGPDLAAGQQLQLLVKGGDWKLSRLITESSKDQRYDFGLVSEAVAPGFDFKDNTVADLETVTKLFPQHLELLRDGVE